MSDDKQARLVHRLSEATERGEIEWKSTAEDQTFAVSFPAYTVNLSEEFIDDSHRYRVSILDQEGTLIDSFTDEDLPDSALYRVMTKLHERARRAAVGADAALDAILGELDPAG